MNGGTGTLSLMNFITIILLIIVVVYLYFQIFELKNYDKSNELQLKNLVNDINKNNYIISKDNPNIGVN
jgi:uncharacterized membrane protein|tara:strand:+ start:94 stop:300 length:207 start_codon:yes stop_codon:yes gene_type:complete